MRIHRSTNVVFPLTTVRCRRAEGHESQTDENLQRRRSSSSKTTLHRANLLDACYAACLLVLYFRMKTTDAQPILLYRSPHRFVCVNIHVFVIHSSLSISSVDVTTIQAISMNEREHRSDFLFAVLCDQQSHHPFIVLFSHRGLQSTKHRALSCRARCPSDLCQRYRNDRCVTRTTRAMHSSVIAANSLLCRPKRDWIRVPSQIAGLSNFYSNEFVVTSARLSNDRCNSCSARTRVDHRRPEAKQELH